MRQYGGIFATDACGGLPCAVVIVAVDGSPAAYALVKALAIGERGNGGTGDVFGEGSHVGGITCHRDGARVLRVAVLPLHEMVAAGRRSRQGSCGTAVVGAATCDSTPGVVVAAHGDGVLRRLRRLPHQQFNLPRIVEAQLRQVIPVAVVVGPVAVGVCRCIRCTGGIIHATAVYRHPQVAGTVDGQRCGECKGLVVTSCGIGSCDIHRIGTYLRLRSIAATLVDGECIGAYLRYDGHHAGKLRAAREEGCRHHDAPAEVVAAGTDIGHVLVNEDIGDRVAHPVVDCCHKDGVVACAIGIGGGADDVIHAGSVPRSRGRGAGSRCGGSSRERPADSGAGSGGGGVCIGHTGTHLPLAVDGYRGRRVAARGRSRKDSLDEPRVVEAKVSDVNPCASVIQPVAVGGTCVTARRHHIRARCCERNPQILVVDGKSGIELHFLPSTVSEVHSLRMRQRARHSVTTAVEIQRVVARLVGAHIEHDTLQVVAVHGA